MNQSAFKQWCVEHISHTASFRHLYQKRPLLMGILNVTPDSFSDGGRFVDAEKAYQHALSMIEQGVDIIDIGGESSRPGAAVIGIEEEKRRILPIIKAIRAHHDICISVDTYKPEVMQAAILAGASMINDIKALQMPNALQTAAELQVPVCLMHMQGVPQTMQIHPNYSTSVVDDINYFFSHRLEDCLAAGLERTNLILDPGFGFGKTLAHNLSLCKAFSTFNQHQCPLILGVSRKSTIGVLINKPVSKRLIGSIALTLLTVLQGVSMIRTHDVDETRQALEVVDSVLGADNQSQKVQDLIKDEM